MQSMMKPLLSRGLRNAVLSPRLAQAMPQRPSVSTKALSFDSVPTEALAAGGAAIASVLGLVFWQATKDTLADSGTAAPSEAAEQPAPPPLPRENAVLVLGATGRVGRRVTRKLVMSGRTVVAAVRSADKARATFTELGLQEGLQQDSAGILLIEQDVDVTRPETLDNPKLWEGVTQVVSLLGPVVGPLPDGGFGFLENMTPERVEAGGWASLKTILPKHLQKQQRQVEEVMSMRTAEDLEAWERLDDVIMGGRSGSGLEPLSGDVAGTVWKGDLITEGGGFCGARTKALNLDLSAYDGIHMRVRGDGSTFKLNIKTLDQLNSPESTYQATFDTVAGQWSDVFLPWHNFVPVKRAQSDPYGTPINPSQIQKFGLVYSRFEFNGAPNPSYTAGPWQLELEGGMRAFKEPRPQIVLISSAGVERNAIIGDDEEKRKQDIPIVQLNPGGTLNYKYMAEMTVRSTGYPYSVIRSTGMIDSNEGGPFLLEADQGDCISGYMGRDDVADIIEAALSTPEACNKTFEVRRSEFQDGKGKAMAPRQYQRLFLKLSEDRLRWRMGLNPMPKAVPPPPPVTEERKGEILEAVKAVRAQESAKTVSAGTK